MIGVVRFSTKMPEMSDLCYLEKTQPREKSSKPVKKLPRTKVHVFVATELELNSYHLCHYIDDIKIIGSGSAGLLVF